MNRRVWIIDPRGHHEPGYYRARLVKGGQFVPVRLWIEEDRDPATGELMADQIVRLFIDGAELRPIPRGYTLMGERIDEREYRAMRKAPPVQEPTTSFDPTRHPSPF